MRKSIAIILCAIFLAPITASAAGSGDKYADAQTGLTYTLYKPSNTLGLSASKFQLITCSVGAEQWLYVKYGGTKRYIEIMETMAGVKCSNPGLSKQLKNVVINGITAELYVYCDPTKPASSAKCGTVDIARVGGYLLFTNKAAKNLKRTEIQVQAIGGVTYAQLLIVAKSLKTVKASGRPLQESTSGLNEPTPTPTPTATGDPIGAIGQPVSPGANNLVLTTASYLPTPPKGGSDEYRCFLLDPNFNKDSFLQSVSIEPDNLKVSHHGILYKVEAASVAASKAIDKETSEVGWPCFGDTGIPGANAFAAASPSSWISFWAPGGNFKAYPVGTGMLVSAGDQFILQSHFHVVAGQSPTQNMASMKVSLTLATTVVDRLKTLLIAAPIEVPCSPKESGPLCTRSAALNDLAQRTSDKAAFQESGLLFICGKNVTNPLPSSVSDCTTTIRSPIKIYGVTAHMHQLGKNINLTYTEFSTKKETAIMSRPVWDFDNQTTDWLTKPLFAMPGDTLKVTCTFDVGLRALLPEFNNISPNYIVWGEGTRDEMCLAIINYTD